MSFLGYVSQSFTQKKHKLRLKNLLKIKQKKPTNKILAQSVKWFVVNYCPQPVAAVKLLSSFPYIELALC